MNLRFLLGRYKYNSDASGIPPTTRDAIRPAGILPSRAPLPGQIADAQGVLGSWLARRGRGAAVNHRHRRPVSGGSGRRQR